MSIIESTTSHRVRSITRVNNLARLALLSGAVFVAAPKPAHASITWIEHGSDSWFNTSQWASGTVTGTLPESGGVILGGNSINLNANNASMPATGVLFDPANQIGNANYIARVENPGNTASFYIASSNASSSSFNAAPNKLTVNSGTLETFAMTIGRDFSGSLVLNGGAVLTDGSMKVGGGNSAGDFATTVNGSGTFEYHGGNLIARNNVQVGAQNNGGGLSPDAITRPEVGKFVVYNDGVNGAIQVANGFALAVNTNNAGTIGIVEFHYDLNQSGAGNVRPIQLNVNTTNSSLKLNNSTNQISELSLVMDAAPTVSLQNLGLFKENTINGTGTFPKIFYATDGTTGFTQGSTISATFGGVTYFWTISYSGIITFTNTATSAYNGTFITSTGGNDVVLIAALPEPSAMALVGGVGSMILARRRRKAAVPSVQ